MGQLARCERAHFAREADDMPIAYIMLRYNTINFQCVPAVNEPRVFRGYSFGTLSVFTPPRRAARGALTTRGRRVKYCVHCTLRGEHCSSVVMCATRRASLRFARIYKCGILRSFFIEPFHQFTAVQSSVCNRAIFYALI